MVPEILPSHWYKYKYCHPLLDGQCHHACVGHLAWISCVSIRTGLQVPGTGMGSRVEISRCWNHTISTRSIETSSCWTESYGTICFLSCKEKMVIKCRCNIFPSLLLLFPAALMTFYQCSQTFLFFVLQTLFLSVNQVFRLFVQAGDGSGFLTKVHVFLILLNVTD